MKTILTISSICLFLAGCAPMSAPLELTAEAAFSTTNGTITIQKTGYYEVLYVGPQLYTNNVIRPNLKSLTIQKSGRYKVSWAGEILLFNAIECQTNISITNNGVVTFSNMWINSITVFWDQDENRLYFDEFGKQITQSQYGWIMRGRL